MWFHSMALKQSWWIWITNEALLCQRVGFPTHKTSTFTSYKAFILYETLFPGPKNILNILLDPLADHPDKIVLKSFQGVVPPQMLWSSLKLNSCRWVVLAPNQPISNSALPAPTVWYSPLPVIIGLRTGALWFVSVLIKMALAPEVRWVPVRSCWRALRTRVEPAMLTACDVKIS